MAARSTQVYPGLPEMKQFIANSGVALYDSNGTIKAQAFIGNLSGIPQSTSTGQGIYRDVVTLPKATLPNGRYVPAMLGLELCSARSSLSPLSWNDIKQDVDGFKLLSTEQDWSGQATDLGTSVGTMLLIGEDFTGMAQLQYDTPYGMSVLVFKMFFPDTDITPIPEAQQHTCSAGTMLLDETTITRIKSTFDLS